MSIQNNRIYCHGTTTKWGDFTLAGTASGQNISMTKVYSTYPQNPVTYSGYYDGVKTIAGAWKNYNLGWSGTFKLSMINYSPEKTMVGFATKNAGPQR